MKIKQKIGFIALITVVDVMVILLVVMSNNKTSVKNDVNTKTSANVILSSKSIEKQPEVIEEKEEPTEIEEEITENEIENNEVENNEVVETVVDNPQPVVAAVYSAEEPTNEDVEPEQTVEVRNVSYDDMTLEEKESALYAGTLPMQYSGLYTESSERLTASRGALYFNGHKETYYSEKVLPGYGLSIPGRHVADDGTIRDEDGYICVAADYSFMPYGSILITSLGPAKVYDTGCTYGIIDIYVSW